MTVVANIDSLPNFGEVLCEIMLIHAKSQWLLPHDIMKLHHHERTCEAVDMYHITFVGKFNISHKS